MSTKYQLPCDCGESLRITTAKAGESVTCPSCGAQLSVPSLSEIRRLEPANRPLRRWRVSRWDARKAWMTVGLVICVASLLTMAVLWAVRPRPPDTSQLTLVESWAHWMALRQGLDRHVSWYTYQLIESRRILRVHTYMCLAAAAVGLAITLTAFVVRRSPIARRPRRTGNHFQRQHSRAGVDDRTVSVGRRENSAMPNGLDSEPCPNDST